MKLRANEPHAVYRMFDADGGLLYVGCSASPLTRLTSHTNHKLWALRIDRVTLEWFPDFVAASAAEEAAIASEGPEWNIKHKTGERKHTWGKNRHGVSRDKPETWLCKVTGAA